MLNVNVANYTDFQGKTNKKIVQAPGGASSISLAWDDDKPDYSRDKNFANKRGKAQTQNYDSSQGQYSINRNQGNQPRGYQYQYENQNGHRVAEDYGYHNSYGNSYGNGVSNSYSAQQAQKGGAYSYNHSSNQNYRNSDSYGGFSPQHAPYSYSPAQNILSYSNNSRQQNHTGNNYINEQINSINYGIRGQQKQVAPSYNNYSNYTNNYSNNYSSSANSNLDRNTDNNYGNYRGYLQGESTITPTKKYGHEELDMALRQQYMSINQPKPEKPDSYSSSSSRDIGENQYRPSVRINGPPPMQHQIGNPDYNFWKDNDKDEHLRNHKKPHSDKRISYGSGSNQDLGYQLPTVQRTSVKVNNPPGGRQSLVLG